MSYPDEMHRELISLRRGRGLQQPGLARRLGPHLKRLSGVSTGETDREAQQRLRVLLTELGEELPDDLRHAAHQAMACDPGSRPSLLERITEYADRTHLGERTVRRRMDDAIKLMVRAAAARHDPSTVIDQDSGWRVRAFSSLLRLDTSTPELYETRTVVAERELRQLELSLDIPPTSGTTDDPAGQLEIDTVYGARLAKVEGSEDGRHYGLTVTLPRLLRAEEQLEFCLHYRVPPGWPIRDYCAIVPLDPCDAGTIRVRFGTPPALAWRLSAIPPRQMDRAHAEPGPDHLDPDDVGEVTVAFRNLRQGHGYGVAWRGNGLSRCAP